MQREKSECEANLEQAIGDQRHRLDEIEQLKDENGKLTREVAGIKDLALSVETEANRSLESMHKRNMSLKTKLNESNKRIHQLELGLSRCNDTDVTDLKTTNTQIKFLQEQLRSATNKGRIWKFECDGNTKSHAK